MPKAWCKHYRGMYEKTSCEAGVKFKDLPHYGTAEFRTTCPCFGPSSSPCEKAEYPTAEELAAEEARLTQEIAKIGQARKAIVESIGGPWKRGKPAAYGTIDCPVCEKKRTLNFSRFSYNGHIHARCDTPGCVAWME